MTTRIAILLRSARQQRRDRGRARRNRCRGARRHLQPGRPGRLRRAAPTRRSPSSASGASPRSWATMTTASASIATIAAAPTRTGEQARGSNPSSGPDVTTPENKAYLRTCCRDPLRGRGQTLPSGARLPRRMNEYLFEDRDPRSLARIAQGAEADVLVFGHTHKPWVREIEGCCSSMTGVSASRRMAIPAPPGRCSRWRP